MSRKSHLVLSECIKCLAPRLCPQCPGSFTGAYTPRSIGFLVPSYYHYYVGSLGLSQFISPDLKSFLRLCLGLQHMTVATKDTWHCSLVLSRDTQLTWENYRQMIWVVARFVCCSTLQNPKFNSIQVRDVPMYIGVAKGNFYRRIGLPLLFSRRAVTFPAEGHHCLLACAKLYCFMTEVYGSEQLA